MLKNKVVILVMFVGFLSLMNFGCKSTPEEKPQEPTQEVAPVEEVAPVVEEQKLTDEELLALVDKARTSAISSSADKLYAAEFTKTDKEFEEVKKDSASIQNKAEDYRKRYLAMDKAANAQKMKERIEGLEFINYDKNSYDDGCLNLENYKKCVESDGSLAEKVDFSDKAFNSLKAVLDKGFLELSNAKKTEVVEVRNKALEIKANKADKVGFDAAQLLLSTAENEYVNKNYETSYEFYSKSQTAFEDVYQNVLIKRENAQAAIERAKSKADAVDQFAAEADSIAPLTEEKVEEIKDVQDQEVQE